MLPCLLVFGLFCGLPLDWMNTMYLFQRRHPYMAISSNFYVPCMRNGNQASILWFIVGFQDSFEHILSKISLSWVMLFCLVDLICQWSWRFLGPLSKCFWFGILHGVCWGIWKERNRRIIEGLSKSPLKVAEFILFEVASWVLVLK